MALARLWLGRCPSQCELAGLGDLSKPTTLVYFFGVKSMFVGVVNFGHNVCRCREFRSNSKNKIRHCEKFSVIF